MTKEDSCSGGGGGGGGGGIRKCSQNFTKKREEIKKEKKINTVEKKAAAPPRCGLPVKKYRKNTRSFRSRVTLLAHSCAGFLGENVRTQKVILISWAR